MTTSEGPEINNRIATVRSEGERLHARLRDGREIAVPLWWYPRLLHATPAQRENWEILSFGDALHWPDIDDGLDVEGFLKGLKAPGAKQPEPA